MGVGHCFGLKGASSRRVHDSKRSQSRYAELIWGFSVILVSKRAKCSILALERGESQHAKLKRVHPSISGRNRMQLCMLSLISVWKKAKNLNFIFQISKSNFPNFQYNKLQNCCEQLGFLSSFLLPLQPTSTMEFVPCPTPFVFI